MTVDALQAVMQQMAQFRAVSAAMAERVRAIPRPAAPVEGTTIYTRTAGVVEVGGSRPELGVA